MRKSAVLGQRLVSFLHESAEGRRFAVLGRRSAVLGQRSAGLGWRSPVHSAVSGRRSPVRSAVSGRRSPVLGQRSAVSAAVPTPPAAYVLHFPLPAQFAHARLYQHQEENI